MKKMYILVRAIMRAQDEGHAVLSVAHAAAAACRDWTGDYDLEDWAANSFRKVLCLVGEEQFEKAKTYGLEHRVMTECALDNEEISIVFKPRDDWPKFFTSLPLWKT